MRGSVRKDGTRGTWLFVIDAPGGEGQRRQVFRRGFRTKGEATAALDAFRLELMDNRVPVPDGSSVEAFAKQWVAALPAEGLEPATVKHYRDALARLLPHVGTSALQDLSAFDLDAAYTALLDAGRAARTVRMSHVAARKMLTEAQRLGRVGRNVADQARPPRPRAATARRFATWTHEQLGAFLESVGTHPDAALLTFAGYTGMRRGELVALRWADVDLDDGNVTVCRSVGKGIDGYHDKAPKSAAGTRVVEIDGPLVAVLRAHKRMQSERRLALGRGWHDLDLVFSEVDGSAIEPDRLSKRWAAMLRREAPALGIPTIRLHDLRHSHCTQLLDAGVRPDVVTERLGHASVAFTLQQYGHRYAGDQRSGLARLRNAAR